MLTDSVDNGVTWSDLLFSQRCSEPEAPLQDSLLDQDIIGIGPNYSTCISFIFSGSLVHFCFGKELVYSENWEDDIKYIHVVFITRVISIDSFIWFIL